MSRIGDPVDDREIARLGVKSLLLRGVAMGARFLLILVLARYLSPSDVGTYGLVLVTVNLGVTIVGAEFWAYSNRAIVSSPPLRKAEMILDQGVFHLVGYGLLGVAITLSDRSPIAGLAGVVFTLTVLEHGSLELHRLLIALQKPVQAYSVLLAKSACWMIPLSLGWIGLPSSRTLGSLWAAWIVGATVSLLVGIWGIRHLPWLPALSSGRDFTWIRRGLGTTAVMLGVGLSLKAMDTVDRYLIQSLVGLEAVGVYTFFWSIAVSLQTAVMTAVASLEWPRYVRAVAAGESGVAEGVAVRALRRATYFGGALFLLLLGAGIPAARLAGQGEYLAGLGLLPILLLVNAVVVLSWIPHYWLFARHKDQALLFAAVFGLLVNVTALLFLVPALGYWGAALGAALGYLALAAARYGMIRLLRR